MFVYFQSFQGSQGRAYLFNSVWVSLLENKSQKLDHIRDIIFCKYFGNILLNCYCNCNFVIFRVNVGCGPAEERLLLTGLHAVADIYCENCHTTLGWKYVSVFYVLRKWNDMPKWLIITLQFDHNFFSPSFSLPLQEQAFELSQKYKEGKFIIELSHMIKDNGWDWRLQPLL